MFSFSRVAQRKRAGPITQRSVDRNYPLLHNIFCNLDFSLPLPENKNFTKHLDIYSKWYNETVDSERVVTRSSTTTFSEPPVQIYSDENFTYFPYLRNFKKIADIKSSRALPLYMRWSPDTLDHRLSNVGGISASSCVSQHFTPERVDRCMKPENVTVVW